MEDAVDALKLSASVFAFVIALSIVFAMFSQARAVSDVVIAHSDNTYYASYVEPKKKNGLSDEIDTDGRIVGIESIIPTLYTFSDGKTIVEIVNGTNELQELFDINVERKYRIRATKYEDGDQYIGYYKNNTYTRSYKSLYPNDVSWDTPDKSDQDLRVSAFIANKEQDINLGKVDYTSSRGLKDTTYREKFIERTDYGDSRIVYPDGSIIDLAKGTTKFYVTYTIDE